VKGQIELEAHQKEIDAVGQPCNSVEYTDKDHGLNDVGLDLVGLVENSAWSIGTLVASHHTSLARG